jgi:hypothetical protein
MAGKISKGSAKVAKKAAADRGAATMRKGGPKEGKGRDSPSRQSTRA